MRLNCTKVQWKLVAEFMLSPKINLNKKIIFAFSESNVSANGTLLRSILKKPKVLPPGMGNTQLLGQVGLKRTQTRYLLARSISECQDESFRINFSLDHLKLDEEVVSIDDLDIPLSVCDESEEFNNSFADDEPEKPSEEHQQKKRVSFNEQVYARVYRSSSSILASRNRQERRHQQQRKKRTESETSEDDSSKVEAKKSPSQEEIVALAGGDTGKGKNFDIFVEFLENFESFAEERKT